MVIKSLFSTYYVLLDTNMQQIWKISLVKLKLILIRIEITELYTICDSQRFQIAVTTLRRYKVQTFLILLRKCCSLM